MSRASGSRSGRSGNLKVAIISLLIVFIFKYFNNIFNSIVGEVFVGEICRKGRVRTRQLTPTPIHTHTMHTHTHTHTHTHCAHTLHTHTHTHTVHTHYTNREAIHSLRVATIFTCSGNSFMRSLGEVHSTGLTHSPCHPDGMAE